MKAAYCLLVLLLTVASGVQAAPPGIAALQPGSGDQQVLIRTQTIQLPSAVKGSFDHFGVDLTNNRLFATAENYQAVLVLDINTGKILHEIKGVMKPHAVLYRDDLDLIYITDGDDGSLKIFDGKTYALRQRIELKKDADSIGYDPLRKLLYVVSGGKDAGESFSLLSVIDTTTGKRVSDIKLEGETLEAMALDVYRPKLYINNPAKNEIDVINRWNYSVIAKWSITMGKRNVAMALDEVHQRLFSACRSGQVVVFDSNTGKELQTFPIGTGVDDLTYDAASKRLYAAGNGSVDVLEQIDADHYKSLGRFEAGPLARNARLVQQINRYFVAVPQSGSANASVAVFEPMNVPAPEPLVASGAKPLNAPFAERLVLSLLSDHPDLRKLGLHAVPPGEIESVIVANGNISRVGVKSTSGDLDAVKDGKTYCDRKENGAFYNMKLPLFDSGGHHIGILVMEIPFTSADSETEAIRKAEAIRAELALEIPGVNRLFGE